MGKKGKYQNKGAKNPNKKIKLRHNKDTNDSNEFDDEIDAFHKKREMIPLDINDDDSEEHDADDDIAVFDYEGINGDDDDEDDEDEDDDRHSKGLIAKIARQQKYLSEKFGGNVEDEMDDDVEDEKTRKVWSKRKSDYYDADNKHYELQSSDEESLAEEEEEVIRLMRERAESLRPEDFGLQEDDEDDSDEEPTLEEIMVKGKGTSKSLITDEGEGDAEPMYEEVKKDLGALSREEQMAIVDSCAPELVGLLAELNDAVFQLETQVNPLLNKVPKVINAKNEGRNYLEMKQMLLLAYCQAITFYLLLKSEGHPVRDHPVIARLVELKSLLDKVEVLDANLPDNLEEILNSTRDIASAQDVAVKNQTLASNNLDTLMNDRSGPSAEKQEASKFGEISEPVKKQSSKANMKKQQRADSQDNAVSSVSAKMLQYRAALEEKLKQKGSSGSVHSKTDNIKTHKLKKLTGLETFDDFDDEAVDLEGSNRASGPHSTLSSKVSKITGRNNLPKGVSGDEDLPERDDLGEKRWKHELRVLAGAGIEGMDDDAAEPENESDNSDDLDAGKSSEADGSEDEFYEQIKNQRAAKLALKAQKYSRNQEILHEPETTLDGKRLITTQIEKNRGLTRSRNKKYKNPRKKNRMKHANAVSRRKGQVRDVRKPSGPYGGETTGINKGISKSIRFKG